MINRENDPRDGLGIPKGYDGLLWKQVKEGDAAVCAAPYAVPMNQKIKIPSVVALSALQAIIPVEGGGKIRKGLLKCDGEKIRNTTQFDDLKDKIITGKKLECEIKRRKVKGNFAKVKCWGIISDIIGDKTVACKGHNIYGDRVDGNVGEIKKENFRDIIHDNVGQCKRLVTHKRRIMPHDVLEKSVALLQFCNNAVLNLNNEGIQKGDANALAPPLFRVSEGDPC